MWVSFCLVYNHSTEPLISRRYSCWENLRLLPHSTPCAFLLLDSWDATLPPSIARFILPYQTSSLYRGFKFDYPCSCPPFSHLPDSSLAYHAKMKCLWSELRSSRIMHGWPLHILTSLHSVCWQYVRNIEKLTGVRYVLVLEVELYIYSHQSLNAKDGVGACHVPETAKRYGGLLWILSALMMSLLLYIGSFEMQGGTWRNALFEGRQGYRLMITIGIFRDQV